MTKTTPKRGDIWLADFEPIHPDEVGKTRPALIIQDDDINEYYNSTVVVPFSSKVLPNTEPLRIFYELSFLDKPSDLLPAQIRVISTMRLIRKLGTLPSSEMSKISRYIGLVLGLGR